MIARRSPDPDRVAEILEQVQRLAPGARARAVAIACRGDAALLEEVCSLLDDGGEGPGRLDLSGPGLALGSAPEVGERIGPYLIEARLGEGGFGVVYRASQSAPVRREVALKVIKLGMDTERVVARFEAERQALALMDHPGIARVFDAGATAAGRPYFAMELVRGEPITSYCRREGLGLRARLELFARVCRAVHHAHQKGVIHRDIKPGNVLVGTTDGRPEPKVIDFGVAKATGAEPAARVTLTSELQVVGTPAYMSPEQAATGGRDIDTRCDVYALGALLYELLTGSAPFRAADLGGGVEGVLRAIREVEPERPSLRVATRGAALRGDLDWIVMRCLEKDRARRYESASGLADDIERHLRDEPVVAGPPSASYRVRKFARRHRAPVVAGAVAAVVLVAGVAALGVLYRWALTERAVAAAQAEVATRALADVCGDEVGLMLGGAGGEDAVRALAGSARAMVGEIEARADELARVAAFQAERLGEVEPAQMGAGIREAVVAGAPERDREALREALAGVNFTDIAVAALEANVFERSRAAIDGQFGADPLVRARLLESHAATLQGVGMVAPAIDAQAEALSIVSAQLGEDDQRTLRARDALAGYLLDGGRWAEAAAEARGALEGRRRVLGADHAETIESMNTLGEALVREGSPAEAGELFAEALERSARALGAAHPETLKSLSNSATALGARGDLDGAESLYRRALEGAESAFGPDDSRTLSARNNLGSFLLWARGAPGEAEPLLREVVRLRRALRGSDHPDTLLAVHNLAVVVERLGDLEAAERLHTEALQGRRRVLGPDDPFTLSTLNNLGFLSMRRGDHESAARRFGEATQGLRRSVGERHEYTLMASGNLARALSLLGRHPEALRELEPAEPHARAAWEGASPGRLATHLRRLGEARAGAGDTAGARAALREAASLFERAYGPADGRTVECADRLGALPGEG